MTAATIIVAVALAKILLAVLAARPGSALGPLPPSHSDADEEEDFSPAFRRKQLEDSPTGNLPSEEYSSAAGSRQALGDFRDPDEYYCHQPEANDDF
jgi:hypothetical protein